MTTSKRPGQIVAHVIWLYFRFPLSLRMMDEMLAARRIDISHKTVRQWALKWSAYTRRLHELPCVTNTVKFDQIKRHNPFEEIADAFRYVAPGQKAGIVVVDVVPPVGSTQPS